MILTRFSMERTDKFWILILVLLTIALRLVFAFSVEEVWWDSGVYIGMGKYLFSGGESGLWEHIRPLLVPVFLGAFWKAGFDPVLFGRFFEILLMGGVVVLTYLFARVWFSSRVAAIAALIVSSSPIFFHLSFHQYTEIPSVFFVLLSLLLYARSRPALSGFFASLAFLSKFPAGIVLPIVLVAAVFERRWKDIPFIVAGFVPLSLAYFVWSWIAYSSPFATLFSAREAIGRALGCNVLRYRPWWHYGYLLVFSESKLHFASLIGATVLYFRRRRSYVLLLLYAVLPIVYFMQLHCRDYRYLTLSIPAFAILTALGVVWLFELLVGLKRPGLQRVLFGAVFVLIAVWLSHTAIRFHLANANAPSIAEREYFSFVDQVPAGEVWVANPVISAYSDRLLNKIYYPIYDKGVALSFSDYLGKNRGRISAVFLDNCGGGIICPPGDFVCDERTESLMGFLDNNFRRVFDKSSGRCWYRVWVSAS
ncbi:phospholipid carrier-dependent glycosyltransferase [Candidatus Woesearchaeota archaeon]|nr:MAG: phospholipid carrier-dependent glycosyltransferase [Candidatus Woesearchaeota archaeon]